MSDTTEPLTFANTSSIHNDEALHWRKALKQSSPILTVVLPYLVVCFFVLTQYNPDILTFFHIRVAQTFVGSFIFISVAAAIFSVRHLIKYRPASPFRSLGTAFKNGPFSSSQRPLFIIAWMCLIVFMPMFVEMKAIFTKIHEFSFDIMLQELDKTLHFGTHPNEWLRPLFYADWVTVVVHKNYYLWFSIIFVTFFWQASTKKDPVLRMQFLTAYFGAWAFVGTVLALSLSSAGPIFYDRIPGGNSETYAYALAHLERVNETTPLMALEVRERLWLDHIGQSEEMFTKGISAMPSMHIAISFLLVLFGWRKSRTSGIVYTILGITTLIGSVHLLWHYAVDGYVSIVAVSLIWWLSGKAARHSVESAKA